MDISLADAALIPVTLGLVQGAKLAGLDSKWATLLAVFLGIILVWILQQHAEWIAGIVVGLSASGLWSGGKTILAPTTPQV